MKSKNVMLSRFLLIAMLLMASLFLAGCPVRSHPINPPPGGGQTPPKKPPAYNGRLPKSGPWGALAPNLAARGFSQKEMESFFNSPNLKYSSAPMETKLRELYGIFYRSDLTKEIQEKLYQLGYDVLIDGRNGSGTRSSITRFQKDLGHSQNGQVSDATLASLKKAMSGKTLRPLSSYVPPPVQKPSRTATHKQFTSPEAVAKITAYYHDDYALFQAMNKKFGVPGPMVASIMWVETGYGSYFGKNKAASMLASMAASEADFSVVEPAVKDLAADRQARAWLKDTAAQRGRWALNELSALMKYAYANNLDPNEFPGSIYGAIGYGQFMPSNIGKYAVDGNGDGVIDLFNKADAIFSIGNYLRAHGWSGSMDNEEKRRAVIMKYNKSGVYVNTVLYVGDWIAEH